MRATLIGLDFGTTTSHALIASARAVRNCVTGRRAWGDVEVIYRSEPVFTPIEHGRIDERRLSAYLDEWLAHIPAGSRDEISGGAIVTGLAAQRANAGAIRGLVQERLGDAVIAVMNDPCLESWVSFMGSCLRLSRAHPDSDFLHLDIGGGTTNLAYARNGEVLATGCLFVGARHFRVRPGTWELAEISHQGQTLLAHLGISRKPGESLQPDEIAAIVRWYVATLEAAVNGAMPGDPCTAAHIQVPLRIPVDQPELYRRRLAGQRPAVQAPIITFSGGVGELIYAQAAGKVSHATTPYGDLGLELAAAIRASPRLSANLTTHVPAHGGRATLYGMTLYSCEVSGATLYLPRPDVLPLRDLPIVARLDPTADDTECRRAVGLAASCGGPVCIQIIRPLGALSALQTFCARLRRELERAAFPADRALAILLPDNAGKTFGNLLSDWGRSPRCLVVIDEVPARAARFVNIGALKDQLVSISYFGMEAEL